MAEKSITSHNEFSETATVGKAVSSENQPSTWEKTTVRQQVTDGSSHSQEVKRFGGNVLVGEHESTSSTTIVRSHSTSQELNFNIDKAFSFQQTTGGETKFNTISGTSWEMNAFSKDSQHTVSREETSISRVTEESRHKVTQISNTEETSSKIIELGQIIAKLEGEKKSIVQSNQSIITELETKCSRYKHDITSLEGRIVVLEEENAKLKAEMKAMTDRFQARNTDFEVSTIKLTQKHGTNEELLEGKISILERDIALLESEKKSLIDSLQEKIIEQNVSTTTLTQEYEAKIDQFEIRNEEYKEKIDALERDIAMLDVEKKTLSNALQEKIIDYNVSTTKLTQEYEAKIGQYEIMMEALKGKLDVFERDSAMLEIEKKNLASSLQEKISEHSISTIQLTQEYETKLGQCEIKIEELEGEIDTLERNIAMMEIEKESLTNSLQEKISEHNITTTKLTQEYETKISEYKKQIEELERKVDMLEQDIAMIENEKKALTNSLQEKISEHTITVTKLTQEYEINVRQYKIEVEVFQGKIRELDGNITRLEEEKKSILDSHQAKVKEYELSITKLTQNYEKKLEQYKVEKNTLQVRMNMLEKEVRNTEVKNEYKTVERESNSLSQMTTVAQTHSNYDKTNALQMNKVEEHSNNAGNTLTAFEKERVETNPQNLNTINEQKSMIRTEEVFQYRNAEDTTSEVIELEQSTVTVKSEKESTVRSYQTEITDVKEKSGQVNVDDATQEMKKSESLSWSSEYGISSEETSAAKVKEECHYYNLMKWRDSEELKNIITKMEQLIAKIKSEKESVLHLNESIITDFETINTKHEHITTKDEGRKDKPEGFTSKLQDDKKANQYFYQFPDNKASLKKLTQDYKSQDHQSRNANNNLQTRTKILEREFNKLESECKARETVNTRLDTLSQATMRQTKQGRDEDTSKMAAFEELPIGSNNFGDISMTAEHQYLRSPTTPRNLERECSRNPTIIKDLEQEYIWSSTAVRNLEWENTSSPAFITDDEQKRVWSPTAYRNLDWENTWSPTNNRYLQQEDILSTITVSNLEWENTWCATLKNDEEQEHEWNSTAFSFLEWEHPLSPTTVNNLEKEQIRSTTTLTNLECMDDPCSLTLGKDLEQEHLRSTTSVVNDLEWKHPWNTTFSKDLEQELLQNTTAVNNLEWKDPLSPTDGKDREQEYLWSTTAVHNLEWKDPWSPSVGKDLEQEQLWSTSAVNRLERTHIGVPAFIRDREQKKDGSLTIFWDLTSNGEFISFINQTSNYRMTTAGVLEASSTQENLWETETIGRVITPSHYTVSCGKKSTTEFNGKCYQGNLMKMIKTTKDLATKIAKLEQNVSSLLEEKEKVPHFNRPLIAEPKAKCDLDEIGMATLDGEMETLEDIAIMDSQPKKVAEYKASTTKFSRGFGKNIALQTRLKMLDEDTTNTQQDYKGKWKNYDTLSQVTKKGDIHFNNNQVRQMTTILIEGRPHNSFTITAMGANVKLLFNRNSSALPTITSDLKTVCDADIQNW